MNKKYIRYDVISTYFYIYLTRIIKRCRHGIMIKKNKKKKETKNFYKNKKRVKNQDVIYFCIYEFLQKKNKKNMKQR